MLWCRIPAAGDRRPLTRTILGWCTRILAGPNWVPQGICRSLLHHPRILRQTRTDIDCFDVHQETKCCTLASLRAPNKYHNDVLRLLALHLTVYSLSPKPLKSYLVTLKQNTGEKCLFRLALSLPLLHAQSHLLALHLLGTIECSLKHGVQHQSIDCNGVDLLCLKLRGYL